MSYTPFKEVTISNPGSSTRFGADDLLDVMKILNGKVVSIRRPEIINPWRWSSWQELKQVTEASVTTPSEADVVHLFLSETDNKLKVKKTGGTIIDLEDIGSGTWSNSSVETITNKTMDVDENTFKHSTTNTQGDILFYDTTAGKYIRLARGTADQSLTVNSAGTSLAWQTVSGGGGGGEANTASNVGTGGIGVFHQKLGDDLQFKQLFSPDGSINISDDTGNEKIDFTLGANLVQTTQSNTYGDFQQTFRSSRLAITNPANTFSYFLVGSALTASRNVFLPLLDGSDTFVTQAHSQTLTNKTLGSGTIANTNTITLKHSTTNSAGELLVNNGTKFDRKGKGSANEFLKVNSSGTDIEWAELSIGTVNVDLDTVKHSTTNSLGDILVNTGNKYDRRAKGSANQYLKVNNGATDLEWAGLALNVDTETIKHSTTNNSGDLIANTGSKYDRFARGQANEVLKVNSGGTGIEWGDPPAGGGIIMPDGSVFENPHPRWGSIYGGAFGGNGLLAGRLVALNGNIESSYESDGPYTVLETQAVDLATSRFESGLVIRRTDVFTAKFKWRIGQTSFGKLFVGVAGADTFQGVGGSPTTIYDIDQNGMNHLEFDGGINRFGVRFDSGHSGLGLSVTEVVVRFRKYGSPSGNATVNVRKGSDDSIASTIGQFAPNSFGSGEQEATVNSPSNTYALQAGDRVTVEFPSNSTNGMELDEDDTSNPPDTTSQEYTTSWSTISGSPTIAIKIVAAPGGGTSSSTPLDSANGLGVMWDSGQDFGNYQYARNDGSGSQENVNSFVGGDNVNSHTLIITGSGSNMTLKLDSESVQTYTTNIPSTTTALAFFMNFVTKSDFARNVKLGYIMLI